MVRAFLPVTLAALMLCTAHAATATTTANLILRRAPSVTGIAVTVIPQETLLQVACNGDWCRTTYRGQGGYVARAYTRAVTRSTPLAQPPSQVTPATPGPVYYRNCTAARAAGAAPIREGELGYRPALDRDHDGIACE